MEISFLVKGVLLGFAIAAPVGPIGVLCIRRTLSDGRLFGLVSGLGAATADAIYGAVAAFGLSFVTVFLVGMRMWLHIVGGLFLCWLGVKIMLGKPAEAPAEARGAGLLAAYATTVGLTITNPMTILSFVAAFAGLGLGSATRGTASAGLLVAGVFLGSALWWLLLSGVVGLFRTRIGPTQMVWVNRLAGAIILAFGIVALLSMRA